MKRLPVKAVLCLAMMFGMFVFSTGSARAFVFTDASALAQRAAQFAQTAAHYTQSAHHYTSSSSHYAQFMGYVSQFNQYRTAFENYYNNFRSVYQRMSSTRYYRDFDVSNWDWTRLDNHLLRTWRTVNQTTWQAQTLALRASRLYENNPLYRRYADRLITLSEEHVESLIKEEALTRDLEQRSAERRNTLARLRDTNADLSTGSDEISAGQQAALTNSILLELAAIQVETSILEQRLRATQQEQQNLIAQMKQLELEARESDALNLEHIITTTTRQ